MEKNFQDLPLELLKTELNKLRDRLRDLEDMHSFTFGRTSVHIGAEKAQRMQLEFEQEQAALHASIEELESLVKERETN